MSLFVASPAGATEKYKYRATAGKDVDIIYTTIDRSGGSVRITNVRHEKVNIFYCTYGLDTTEWEMVNRPEDVDVKALRDGNAIVVKGTFDGKRVDKKEYVDARPWYQSIPFSLTDFSASSEGAVTFWTLSPDDQTPVKMKATRKSIETVDVAGKAYEARKVRVRLTGVKSIFWAADFWYRAGDGLFVKFEGNKGPGTPTTVIELIGEG